MVFFALAACSSADPQPAATETAKLEAPPKASIDQGRTVRLAIKLTGATASDVKIKPSEGLTAALEGNELVLSAGYGAPPAGTVAIDAKEAHVDVAVDVRALDWKARVTWQAGQGPIAREHASFFEDDEKRVVYMLHGSGYAPYGEPVSDAFVFDVAARTWAPWTPTGDVPEPAGGRRTSRAPGANVHYLYGGYLKDNKDSADIYRVDLANSQKTFTKLVQSGAAPVGRSLQDRKSVV